MMELVDIPDLKSGAFGRAGSIPAPGTNPKPPLFLQGRLFHFWLRAQESLILGDERFSMCGIHFSALIAS